MLAEARLAHAPGAEEEQIGVAQLGALEGGEEGLVDGEEALFADPLEVGRAVGDLHGRRSRPPEVTTAGAARGKAIGQTEGKIWGRGDASPSRGASTPSCERADTFNGVSLVAFALPCPAHPGRTQRRERASRGRRARLRRRPRCGRGPSRPDRP